MFYYNKKDLLLLIPGENQISIKNTDKYKLVKKKLPEQVWFVEFVC